VLVDQVAGDEGPAVIEPSPVGDGDRVSYELEHWGNQLKVSLEGMLDQAGIRRLWEVGALVVAADDAEVVESLIETVEGRDVEDLQEMEEQLAFEIEGLDAEDVAELDARLIAAGIAHAWSEEGELLVALDHEEAVSAIVDAVVEGEVDDEVDGLAANQVLSDIYVALDRLVKAPTDHKLIQRLTDAAEPLKDIGVPYGFAAQEWAELKQEVADVVAVASGEEPEDDGAVDAYIDDDDGEQSDEDEMTEEDRFVQRAQELREQLLAWV